MHILADTLAGYFTTGDVLLLGDGEIAFSVVEVAPDGLIVRSYGGLVPAGRFGVAVSGKEGHHGAPPIDHATVRLASAISDAVVLGSFIESAAQIEEMRKLLPPKRAVWAKVETRAGVEHALEIAAEADGILLGRGDLLIDAGELDYYHYEQLAIDRLARADVPLMIGTQLWTSSSTMFLPHRSELSYLCSLIARGIDSILLSDETTTGANPEQIVAQVSRLITRYQRN
jgi:pyruvate kinase